MVWHFCGDGTNGWWCTLVDRFCTTVSSIHIGITVHLPFKFCHNYVGVQSNTKGRFAQSVQRLATGWTVRGSKKKIPVRARFSAPVQTGPGAHLASCTMGTRFFPGVKSGRGVTLTPHPLIVPWSRKSRAIPLLPLWAVRPVQSLSACTRVHFTFTLQSNTNYICYGWFTNLSTTTCFYLYIGHHQAVLLLVISLTTQYTVWLLFDEISFTFKTFFKYY